MTGLGIAAWASSATLIGSLAWVVVQRHHRRRVLVGVAVALAAIVALVVIAFEGMGAFCVPPPGAACQ